MFVPVITLVVAAVTAIASTVYFHLEVDETKKMICFLYY